MTLPSASGDTEATARREQMPHRMASARRSASQRTVRPRHKAMNLDTTANEHLSDELGWEETMLHHARDAGEACRELGGILDRAEVVGDQPAVRARWRIPERDRRE